MLFEIQNGGPRAAGIEAARPGSCFLAVVPLDEAGALLSRFGLPERLISPALQNRAMSFENHEGFYFICLNMLEPDTPAAAPGKVCVYFSKELLLLTGSDTARAEETLRGVLEETSQSPGLDRMLMQFLGRLTVGDTALLEDIEQEITDLEDALISESKRSAVREITSLRQRLMVYKRYYEQLLGVLDMLAENDEHLITSGSARLLKTLASRADRLYRAVLNLRDYVTQVREAYQAEVDISLNNIMKIFTVITAIFLPLTLIVGWYGMNFKMPEYGWRYGYLGVAGLSLAVVVFCLVIFKKRKWF